MPQQEITKEEPQKQGDASEALKKVVEKPKYTEKSAEEIGSTEQHQKKLGEIARQNREAIQSEEKVIENVRQKIGHQPPTVQGAAAQSGDDKKEVKRHASEIMNIQDAEQQIDKVLEIATSKDPFFAIKVAQELDDNFLLDRVHDELIEDKVRNILVDKGMLKAD